MNDRNNNLPPLPQRVTSERLVIRPSVRADAPFLQRWWNDPDVMAPDGHADGMQYDEADIEQWFQRYVDCRACANHFVPSSPPVRVPKLLNTIPRLFCVLAQSCGDCARV